MQVSVITSHSHSGTDYGDYYFLSGSLFSANLRMFNLLSFEQNRQSLVCRTNVLHSVNITVFQGHHLGLPHKFFEVFFAHPQRLENLQSFALYLIVPLRVPFAPSNKVLSVLGSGLEVRSAKPGGKCALC